MDSAEGNEIVKSCPESPDAALQEIYRLAQVGCCVNGVAHDINNLLGVAMAYAELVGLDRNLAPDSKRMLGDIDVAIRRCGDLVSGITAIARPLRPSRGIVDPAMLVAAAIRLREYVLKMQQIQVLSELKAGGVNIAGDAVQLQLALLYLLINAQEALENADEKCISIRMETSPEQVAVVLWDSGPGVPEELRERIFEPGMTTKTGTHLGFGLAQARSIAREHGGDVVYDPGRGFVMTLGRGAVEALA